MKFSGHRFDELQRKDWKGETVFALGNVSIDRTIPQQNVVFIPSFDFVNPVKLCDRLPVEAWKRGVIFVMPRNVGPKEAEETLRLQKRVFNRLYHTEFQQRVVDEIDEQLRGVMGKLKDPSRSLSQYRNYPWLLRYPLANKLTGRGSKCPALVLTAGPSLRDILPRLPELAERCIVICISRTLKLCLDAGVEPDFVVQYDTNLEQRQFYAGLPRLERTSLVTLSSASVHPFAELFRGVFFRASFGQPFLPSTFALRDSVEGSLIACLGVAEVLGSPQVYISGADLSWAPTASKYASAESARVAEVEAADMRAFGVNSHNVRLGRRDGQVVETTYCFVAASIKAADVAQEISAETGAAFYSLADATLLPAKEFPHAPIEQPLAQPPLDRKAFLGEMDAALNTREKIDLGASFQFLRAKEADLKTYQTLFMFKRLDPSNKQRLGKEFIVQLMGNMRGASWPDFGPSPDRADRFLTLWREALIHAAQFVFLHQTVSLEERVPLLCFEHEEEELVKRMDRLVPGCPLEVRRAVPLGKAGDGDGVFDDYMLPRLYHDCRLLLVSPKVMEQYAHFWEQAAPEKYFNLRKLGPNV